MNREIKFRFFTPDRRMIYDHNGWVEGIGINEALKASSEYGYKPMQYTGLKDKNGKEIYEGDILATSNDGKNGHDEWTEDDWGYGIVQLDIIGGLLVNGWMSSLEHNDSVYSLEYVEVIGNIYENPELLT